MSSQKSLPQYQAARRDELPVASDLPPLPQSGWYLSEAFCVSMDISYRQFCDAVRKHNIPHRQFGRIRLYHAETFYASLPGGETEEVTSDKKTRKRGR